MNWSAELVCAWGVACIAGCGGATPSAAPPPSATAESVPATETSATAPLANSSHEPISVPAGPDTSTLAEPTLGLTPLCQAMCDKLVAKCGKVSVSNCRLNCGKYDPPPPGCDDQVRAGLECARDAKDLTCANVAPESCSHQFRQIAACSSGVTLEKPPPAAADLPPGWERVTDAANGFSVVMPRGATEKPMGDGFARAVTSPDGTTYSVSVRPVPLEKPSEKSLLFFLMKIQGRCSDKLHLDGFVEKAGQSQIHFTSRCPDKTDWNGMLYIGTKHLVMLSAQAPSGQVGLSDPFFYSLQYLTP